MTRKPRRPRKPRTSARIELPLMQLPHAEGLPLPAYQTAGASISSPPFPRARR